MIGLGERLGLRALGLLDPETAHAVTILALRSGLNRPGRPATSRRLNCTVAGLDFANPLGVAAGFDKDAVVVDPVLRLGFGFCEVGTVTPQPQPGNPRPRLFRLGAQQAVINRYGFNSQGHEAVHRRLAARRGGGIVGVNIGANKSSADRTADYVAGVTRFADCASYLTVNISSPNTPGLRALQSRGQLEGLVQAVGAARDRAAARLGRRVPVFVKIAPDLGEDELDDLCAVVATGPLDGLVVSNTTLSRAGVENSPHADEAGGLSGRPLFERSTVVLARARRRVGPDFPIIGVGGIGDAESAWQKIVAGANLLQLYTGLVFNGSSLVPAILAGLLERLDRHGHRTIAAAVGAEADRWADRPV